MELEEPNEVLCDGNKADLEKKKGRRFKTPSQVQALEEFYTDRKYPTESMKAELADRLGLTERQVAGWFCHRRLKDKRLLKDEALGTGRQDLSSGVIQDRGSGLRQDSCGSTKQTDRRPDPREVESRRLSGEDLPLADATYEQRPQFDATAMDETSSESDSDLQEEQGFYPQRRNLMDVEVSQYAATNTFAHNPRARSGPSGYLKIKGQTENAAITAVKRQLGSHYRINGPPLGVDFESLPPGAFEYPTKAPIHEPYRGPEAIVRSPVDKAAYNKQSSLYDRNPDSYEDPINVKSFCESDRGSLSYRQAKSFVSPTHANSYPYEKSPLGAEYPVVETSARDSSFDYGVRNRHGMKAPRPDSLPSQYFHVPIGKTTIDQAQLWNHEYGNSNMNPKMLNRREIREPKAPSSTVRRKDSFNSKERVPSAQMVEEENLYEFKRSRPWALQRGAQYTGKRSVGGHLPSKRGRGETLMPSYVLPSFQDQSQWANPLRQSAPEIPSGFSEDETAETSSSVD